MKVKNWQIGLAVSVTATAVLLNFSSCVSIPKGAIAVKPFDKNRYLGTWYEIARMDFRFEKDLSDVSAKYSLSPDGSIRVENKGYDYIKERWKESVGKAKSLHDDQEGRLKVSFFGPFYAGYNVIAIDDNYQYALVAGNDLEYLWILSREKKIPAEVRSAYLEKARGLGYNVTKLIWTKQNK